MKTLIRRRILGLYCLAFPHTNDVMFASADLDPHRLPPYHSTSIHKNTLTQNKNFTLY